MLGGPFQETVDVLAELRDRGPALRPHELVGRDVPVAAARYPFLAWFEAVIVVSGEVGLVEAGSRDLPVARRAPRRRAAARRCSSTISRRNVEAEPGVRVPGDPVHRRVGPARRPRAARAAPARSRTPSRSRRGPGRGLGAGHRGPRDRALLRPGAVLHRLATGATWAEGPVWLPAGRLGPVERHPQRPACCAGTPTGRVSVFLEPAEFENGHTLDHDGSIVACSHGHRRLERLGLDGTLTPDRGSLPRASGSTRPTTSS